MASVFARARGPVPLRSIDCVVLESATGPLLVSGLERLEAEESLERRSTAYLEAVGDLFDGLPEAGRRCVTESLGAAAGVVLLNLGGLTHTPPPAPGLLQEPPETRLGTVVASIGRRLGRPCRCHGWLGNPGWAVHDHYGDWLLKHESARREDEAAVLARWEEQTPRQALVERGRHWAVVGCVRPGHRGLVMTVGTLDAAVPELSARDAEEAQKKSWTITVQSPHRPGLGVVTEVALVAAGPDGHLRLQADLGAVTSRDKRAEVVLDRLKAALEDVSQPHQLAAGQIVIVNKHVGVYSVKVPDGSDSPHSHEEKGNYWWLVSTEVVERSVPTSTGCPIMAARNGQKYAVDRQGRNRLQEPRRRLAS